MSLLSSNPVALKILNKAVRLSDDGSHATFGNGYYHIATIT